MQVLTLTQLPLYLPADTAQQPFGDPLSDISVTSAAPGVVTSPGYNPTNGDAVAFSFAASGSMPTGLTAGTRYYVVSASGDTFSVSATKGGAAITTSSTGSLLTLHLLSSQVYGTRHPFKTGDSVVALNPSASAISVQAAPDVNGGYPGGPVSYGNPGGPGTYTTIATIAAGSAATIVLSNDWISLTASGSLILMQN
jgi:hypothetical protein